MTLTLALILNGVLDAAILAGLVLVTTRASKLRPHGPGAVVTVAVATQATVRRPEAASQARRRPAAASL